MEKKNFTHKEIYDLARYYNLPSTEKRLFQPDYNAPRYEKENYNYWINGLKENLGYHIVGIPKIDRIFDKDAQRKGIDRINKNGELIDDKFVWADYRWLNEVAKRKSFDLDYDPHFIIAEIDTRNYNYKNGGWFSETKRNDFICYWEMTPIIEKINPFNKNTANTEITYYMINVNKCRDLFEKDLIQLEIRDTKNGGATANGIAGIGSTVGLLDINRLIKLNAATKHTMTTPKVFPLRSVKKE